MIDDYLWNPGPRSCGDAFRTVCEQSIGADAMIPKILNWIHSQV
jgi:hypothetical protein